MKKSLLSLVVLVSLALGQYSNAQTTAGTLSFAFTPVAHSGSWGAKHVLAVWIQDNSSSFIKTKFRYWGNGTNDHLPNWVSNSSQNITDATTGATLTSYTTKSFTWDGTNLSGTLLPDGDYKVTIEECWSHGSSKVTQSFTFTKSGTEVHLAPTDDSNFTNVTLDWIPNNTGIESLEKENNFTIFPNPAENNINIDFKTTSKPCNIYILNTLGQEIYSEKGNKIYSGVKRIDLSSFKNGIYFVNIEQDSKVQTQKIVLLK